MPKKWFNYREDLYSVQIISPSEIKDGTGKRTGNPVQQVSSTVGFTDLKHADKFVRTHGMKNDQYVIRRHGNDDKVSIVDEGVVGGNLKNKQGVYTNYHFLQHLKTGKKVKGQKGE